MITFVSLPGNRWLIECNGVRGPSADYTQCAFWPTMANPELIGHTAYFNQVWKIHSEVKEITLKDESSLTYDKAWELYYELSKNG